MPIKEFPGSIGWGYIPRYYFAIESSYGTTMDLKEMIDTFHKNGIRVITDGVYNHVSSFFLLQMIRKIKCDRDHISTKNFRMILLKIESNFSVMFPHHIQRLIMIIGKIQ
jgi:1,4-alpha-glucan branching enzyme